MSGRADMGVQELRQRLLAFDRAVALLHPSRRFELTLVGGGALALLGCITRETSDLDALRAPKELTKLMEEYDISARVVAYETEFAYHVDDRRVRIDLDTRAVEFYSASLEDLVAAKLSSSRPVDQTDVRAADVVAAIDWSRLDEVIKDSKLSSLNDRRYGELLAAYAEYRKGFGPCDS